LGGCVTLAEHRKLAREVRMLQRGDEGSPGGREQLADLSARIDSLQEEMERLRGRIEEAGHRSAQALEEAQRLRRDVATLPASGGPPAAASSALGPPPLGAPTGQVAEGESPETLGAQAAGATSEEVQAYRAAYAAWRSSNNDACIDQFRNFLQAYPASAYADDATYWMADCYFKKEDFKTSILRFDDVVQRYPKGNKAADALYRQGQALLKLGPGYSKAAGKAFERVLSEYPESPRSAEAKRQLELLSAG